MTDTSESTQTEDVTAVVDTYFAAWNEPDPSARAELIEQAWAPAGRYVDPLQESDGHEGFSELAANVHAAYPGQRFRRLTQVDVHHDQARFGWELSGDAGVTVAGVDVARIDPDGKLAAVTGFFGDLT